MTQSDAGVASLTPTKITPAELDAFSAAQVQGSFQQTSQMAAMGAFNGPVDYVGVKRGDKLIAACYVVYTQSRFGLEGSVWCGPLCDYAIHRWLSDDRSPASFGPRPITPSAYPAGRPQSTVCMIWTASRPATRTPR